MLRAADGHAVNSVAERLGKATTLVATASLVRALPADGEAF